MIIDRETLNTMEKAGISFLVGVRVPSGHHDLWLKAKDVERFIADRDAVTADSFGLSKDEYEEWISIHGHVQCSSNTTSGSRCKNFVSGGTYDDAGEWKSKQGEYCAVHGGAASTVK